MSPQASNPRHSITAAPAPCGSELDLVENSIRGYFSASYRSARAAVLARTRQLDSPPSIHHCLQLGARGPNDEALICDWMQWGSERPRRVFVLSSGIHGVEGFTGSAIQCAFITQRLAKQLTRETSQRMIDLGDAFVLVHALNPYGFAWLRRVNENNIDLNRNFLASFPVGSCSDDYRLLFDALNPAILNPQSPTDDEGWKVFEAFAATHGFRRAQQVAFEGQYAYPDGLQFGGARQAATTRFLLDRIKTTFGNADAVVWLDVHTGLGEFASCELLNGSPIASDDYRFSNQIWSQGVVSAADGESVSTPLNGLLDRGIRNALSPRTRLGFAYAEFGTHPPDRVLAAMRLDNWLYRFGDRESTVGRLSGEQLAEAFFPRSHPEFLRWQKAVIEAGLSHCDDALRGLSLFGPATDDRTDGDAP